MEESGRMLKINKLNVCGQERKNMACLNGEVNVFI